MFYFRENGPQCLNAAIFSRQESADLIVHQILSCPLTRYWSSAREEGRRPLPGQPELPQERRLTLLNQGNARELASDIDEVLDEEPVGLFRFLILIGVKGELAPPIDESLNIAIKRFLTLDLNPVETVLVRIPDMAQEYLYLRHEVTPAVQCLLKAWQLDPSAASKARPYDRLRSAQLESLFHAIKVR